MCVLFCGCDSLCIDKCVRDEIEFSEYLMIDRLDAVTELTWG